MIIKCELKNLSFVFDSFYLQDINLFDEAATKL